MEQTCTTEKYSSFTQPAGLKSGSLHVLTVGSQSLQGTRRSMVCSTRPVHLQFFHWEVTHCTHASFQGSWWKTSPWHPPEKAHHS